MRSEYQAELESALGNVDAYKPESEMLSGKWADYVWPNGPKAIHQPETGVNKDKLVKVARASVSLPDTFVR